MSKENNNEISIKENDLLIEKHDDINAQKELKKQLILPSLKNNFKTISTNQDEKKIAFYSIKKYNQDLKNSLRTKKLNLNKNILIPNIKENEYRKINQQYQGKIYNYSNRATDIRTSKINDNKKKHFISMREPNRTNKIKKNFFNDKVKNFQESLIKRQNSYDSGCSNEKSLILNLTKNTNTNEEMSKEGKSLKNLNYSKSTVFKISKINLNKYPISKINESKNKQTYISSISSIPKYSKFFHKSQNNTIGTHTIYKYYLNKSSSQITLPVQNYNKLFKDRSHSVIEKLKRIYCENKNFDSLLRELKDNHKIAFKDDFDIEEYQNTLLELLEKRVSQKHLIDLQDDYRALNKKLFNVFEPKGRFTVLAEKLRYNLPSFLIEKMKQLDKDSIISRMKYYNQFKEFKKDKKLVIKFGRRDEGIKLIKKKKIKEEINGKDDEGNKDNNI